MTPEQFNRHKERLVDLIRIGRITIFETAFDENDNFAFLSFCFLSKQIQHTESILKLNGDRDAWLIGRSMLEGYFQWLYILANVSQSLSERWRAFIFVSDWRKKHKRLRKGEEINQETKDQIDGLLQMYSGGFLTEKAKKALKEDKPLPDDPFVNNWLGLSVRELFYALPEGGMSEKEISILYGCYNYFSEWAHSSSAGIGRALQRNENGILEAWITGSAAEYIEVTKIAFMCLIKTLIGISISYESKHLDSLYAIEKSYFADLNSTNN